MVSARRSLFIVLGALFVLFQLFYFSRPLKSSSSVLIASSSGADSVGHAYTRLLSTLGEHIGKLDYGDKCDRFFHSLFTGNEGWRTSDFAGMPYHNQIFELKEWFVNTRLEKFKKSLDDDLTDKERDKIAEERSIRKVYELEYDKAIEETRTTEKHIADAAAALRVYGACYLHQFGERNTQATAQQCTEIENRMFQWLSRSSPKFTRWTGQTMTHVPVMSQYLDQGYYKAPGERTGCFLRDYRDQLNGKGYVISAANGHVSQLMSLFAILRATGNILPIQVSHSGDLSKSSQEELVHAARTLKLNFKSIENVETVLKLRGIEKDVDELTELEIEQLFPPIELWFIDVSPAISARYKSKYGGYANKLLAYFFCSFKDTMLIDTDTVPLADLNKEIFESWVYQEQGAYFFKDRELKETRKKSNYIFFKKLMPTAVDELLFGIPRSTDKTLKNRLMGDYHFHFMESGVVAIDKQRHFTGVLATLMLNIWAPVLPRVWGDKELFWLGMSLAGDEDYYMNYWAAGSVGQITPLKQRLPDDTNMDRKLALKGNQVCSSHPAHISGLDNTTLLWFNSGITVCKHTYTSKEDAERSLYGPFYSAEEIDAMYKDYTRIEAVIVPKHQEYFAPNDLGENERGWEAMKECRAYTFCAYDKVAGKDLPQTNGLLVQFNDTQKDQYNFIGSCGVHPDELFRLKEFKSARD